ncbi:hypothetical protein Micbo1qcDRAFT_179811 [Microdochium bolleyi]|uniref:Cyanovirin-N domain-containing protein n=1 Tax=Microdochium bolleyi TaxID=196109 RepID=A0A136INQ9_9PEZI|nr:hypothetical protein Micbo1qcDRAFT_179811 [Microdochium bolleyi]
MKMISNFATILTVAAALVSASPIISSPDAVAAGNEKRQMYKYCNDDDWNMKSGTILNGWCRADDGTMRPESIDLNQCLGNANGKLVHQPGGGYANSCDTAPGSHSFSSGTTVCTTCTSGDGSRKPTCAAIDDFATVNNGRLSCRG